MILYLYLQIKPIEDIKFSSALSEDLRAIGFDVVQIDLDSRSEAYTINKSIEPILHAEKLILHVDAVKTEALGALTPVFEKLRHFNQPILCLQEGENDQIDNMLKLLRIESKDVRRNRANIDALMDFLAT